MSKDKVTISKHEHERLLNIEAKALTYVRNSYTPECKNDKVRFLELAGSLHLSKTDWRMYVSEENDGFRNGGLTDD
jgi:hypothetical protein